MIIQLSDQIPWVLRFSGGASNMRLDLSQLTLTRLDLSGGARRLDLTLPQPKGTVAIHISGGASDLSIRAPRVTAWRFHLSGGAHSLNINGSHQAAFGNLSQESPNYRSAENRFDIQISGGASNVRFDS
jgi:hypothetical protein